MTPRAWHPSDERTAASNLTAFVEWLRATGRRPLADPADVATWRLADPPGFAAAFQRFAPGADPAEILDRDRKPDN